MCNDIHFFFFLQLRVAQLVKGNPVQCEEHYRIVHRIEPHHLVPRENFILCIYHLSWYILSCSVHVFSLWPTSISIEGSLDVSLKDVMVFATGCDDVPILGFDRQPSLQFSCNDGLPTASTCGPTLRLPLKVEGAEQFTKNMRFALACSFGFGQV